MKKMLSFFKNKKILSIVLGCVAVITIIVVAVNLNKKENIDNKPEMCVVQFEANGGTTVAQQEIECGSVIVQPDNPQKEGFVFKYWEYNGEEYNFSNPVETNIVLKPFYEVEENVEIVVISFDIKGGNKIEDIKIKKGETIEKPILPKKAGYKFIGWYIDNKEYSFSNPIDKDITLEAKWEKQNSNISNGGNTNPNVENNDEGNCLYTLNENSSENFTLSYTSQPVSVGFNTAFNHYWSYNDKCDVKYSSSNSKVATVDKNGLINVLKEGNVIISRCIYNKKDGKKLECFDGNLTTEKVKSNYYDNPKIPYEQIKGKWYAKYSNVSYVNFSNYKVSKENNYQTFSYQFYGITEDSFSYSCESGKCENLYYRNGPIYGDWTILSFEEKYSPKIVNNSLFLTSNGKTIEFTRDKAVVPVQKLFLSEESRTVTVESNFFIQAYIVPNNASVNEIIWESSNPDVAVVSRQNVFGYSENGNRTDVYIKTLSPGTTTFTATTKDGNFSKKFVLKVDQFYTPVTSVTLNKENVTIDLGSTETLRATIEPSNASVKGLIWSSSDSSVATVDSNGVVTAKKSGYAKITVKSEEVRDSFSDSCLVHVVDPNIKLTADTSIGLSYIAGSTGTSRGIKVTVTASGGSGSYNYYSIKLYKDGVLIGSSTNTNSNTLFVEGHSNGSYYAEIEVHDTEGNVFNATSSVSTISGF